MIPVIDLAQKLRLFDDLWSPKTIARTEGVEFKLVHLHGEFVWHAHPDADETFLVLEGSLVIETRAGDLHLKKGQMAVIPKGVEHRPVALELCAVMLIEPLGLVNTGDAETDRTAPGDVWI